MSRHRFSANLGYLWKKQPLAQRILNAKTSGFDAVELHDDLLWNDVSEITRVFRDVDLPVLSINTYMGETIGQAAMPGHRSEARASVTKAVELAETVNAANIHILSGFSAGEMATDTLLSNLDFATQQTDRTLLIEPICSVAAPEYFLKTPDQALEIVQVLGSEQVKIMFDCFHIAMEGFDVWESFCKLQPHIGHIQISSVPDRHEPDHGDIDYTKLLNKCVENGYSGWFGCEYNPLTTVEEGLHWRETVMYS